MSILYKDFHAFCVYAKKYKKRTRYTILRPGTTKMGPRGGPMSNQVIFFGYPCPTLLRHVLGNVGNIPTLLRPLSSPRLLPPPPPPKVHQKMMPKATKNNNLDGFYSMQKTQCFIGPNVLGGQRVAPGHPKMHPKPPKNGAKACHRTHRYHFFVIRQTSVW